MKSINFMAVFSILFCVSCTSDDIYDFKRDRIQETIEQHSLQPINEYTVYRAPSFPKKINRMVTSWDPVEALVVAMPYENAISNFRIFEFYMTIIENAVRVTNVILLLDERESYAFKEILDALTSLNLDRYLYGKQKHQIRIVPARFNTKWIRDYGPLFALDTKGGMNVIDAIYQDVRRKKHTAISLGDFFKVDVSAVLDGLELANAETSERNEDDAVSMYLANYLYQNHRQNIQIIRVPLQLQGGDVFADGTNNLFISTESLLINGGHRVDVELILRSYYGVKSLTYLEPFPGETIKHLDMIFMPFGADLFFVADYPADTKDDDIYMQYLHHETKRILDNNANILQQNFPQRRIVRIPMPPVERLSKLNDHALELTKALFISKNYNMPEELIDMPELWNADNFVFLCYILTQYRELSTKNELGQLENILGSFKDSRFSNEYEAVLNRSVKKLIKRDSDLRQWMAELYRSRSKHKRHENLTHEALLKELLADYIQEGVYENPYNYNYVYRSYLNATYINGLSGRMLLVPSYAAYKDLERQVYNIYRELFPNTEIVFINSDEIIKQYGAIHCVTVTVPDFKRK